MLKEYKTKDNVDCKTKDKNKDECGYCRLSNTTGTTEKVTKSETKVNRIKNGKVINQGI